MYNKKIDEAIRIKPAPDWRLLKEFGGCLTIEEYRKNFNKLYHKKLPNYISMKSIGWLYEKISEYF